MKIIYGLLQYAAAILLLGIILITSIELVAYADKGFYEREYRKYDVIKDVNMEMEDVLTVTEEMMSYLRGGREDLVVQTTVGGESREFFNDREKAHMADVRNLFIAGLIVRGIAAAAFVLIIIFLLLKKADLRKAAAAVLVKTFAAFDIISLLIVILASRDFTKFFTTFHHIFFNNDLWLLDPNTDLLINILPEGFFMDIAIEILIVFMVLQTAIVLAGFLWKGKRAK